MQRAIAILLALAIPFAAAARDLSIPWHDLRPFILHQKVTITGDRGAMSGRVVSVSNDALKVRSGRSTETIAAAGIATITVTRYDGRARRIGLGAGFVFGMVLGLIAFVYFGLDETSSDSVAARKVKAVAAWLGTWAGMTLGGWLIGRLIDREVLLIRPVPAAPART